MSATPAVSKTKSGKVKIVLDNEMAGELLETLWSVRRTANMSTLAFALFDHDLPTGILATTFVPSKV